MEPADFVKALYASAPSVERLAKERFNEAMVEETREGFQCVRRNGSAGIDTHRDHFLRLIDGWDLSRLSIGPLTFCKTPSSSEKGLTVGNLELDLVQYDINCGSYSIRDHESPDRIVCEVAKDGGAFMETLIVLARTFGKLAIDDYEPFSNEDEVLAASKEECMQILAGSEYDSFMSLMLGV